MCNLNTKEEMLKELTGEKLKQLIINGVILILEMIEIWFIIY